MKKIAIFIASIFVVFSGYFLTPAPLVHAQTTDVDTAGGGAVIAGQGGIEGALSSCNIITSFSVCVLWFIYHVILGISVWVVGLAGQLFDYFIFYSLNSDSYRSEFISKGWGLIRDIANVAFIFTLLYLAIKHILGDSSKKYIPTLIIVALLLNFSLFFTKVAIDAGNILGRAFFNSITVDGNESDINGVKQISIGVMNNINPQKLLDQSLFLPKPLPGVAGDSQSGQVDPNTGAFVADNNTLENNFGYFAFIFILLAIVNFILAGVFLSVSLLFVARVIGLWFAMIFSPIAFITLAVPGSSSFVKQLSFDTWKDNVIKLSFLAPIFMFFLYLTVMFIQIVFSTPIDIDSRDTFTMIMEVFIPFIFVIIILNTAKKVATEMAGDFGAQLKALGGKIAGFVGGVALGGTAMLGRKAIGGFAAAQLKGGNYEQRIADATASGDRARARRLMNAQKGLIKLNESSFDIRNAPKAKGWVGKASGVVGGGFSSGMKDFGGDKMTFGKGSDQSRKKYLDDAQKEKMDRAKELSTVRFDEPEQLKKAHKEDLEQEKKDRESLKQSFADQNKILSDELGVINKKEKPTEDEIQRSYEIEAKQKELKEQESKIISEADKRIKQKESADPVKAEKNRRLNMYAKEVSQQDWYNFRTEGQRDETVDKIRGLIEKDKSKKEKALEDIEKVLKDEIKNEDKESDKPKEEEEKKEDKPKDEEKK